ncbi:hypothetical protein [Cetobacterium sp. SF1]|uniref:hypothetical protein n=1 Tax=Cetobacterium sp. SF1 TaxID=3417654 RepID=UPI003CF45046
MSKKLKERLKNALQASEEKAIETLIGNIEEVIISENSEENKFLLEKTKEILNVQAKASLELGKIFEEVVNRVNDNTYCKWLEFNGFNKTTAFRHRRRYNLFQRVISQRGKEIVALCSYREIDKMYKEDSKYFQLLEDETLDYTKLKTILKNQEDKENSTLEEVHLEFDNIQELFKKLDEKIKGLDQKKQTEVKKHLNKIWKILA